MEETSINSYRTVESPHPLYYLCACHYWPLQLSSGGSYGQLPGQNFHDQAIGVGQVVGDTKGSSTQGALYQLCSPDASPIVLCARQS